jgi:hypothetical protein
MTESEYWRQCRDALYSKIPKQYLHLTRIENWAGVGVSDLNGCYHGNEFWVEFKVAEQRVKFQKGQVPWIYRRWRAGGKVFIAVIQKETQGLYLFHGGYVKELAEKGFHDVPYVQFLKAPIQWFRFLELVSGEEIREAKREIPVIE